MRLAGPGLAPRCTWEDIGRGGGGRPGVERSEGGRDKRGACTQYNDMDDSNLPSASVPQTWALSLERADADMAAGRIVPASKVHAMLLETLEEMEAETAKVR